MTRRTHTIPRVCRGVCALNFRVSVWVTISVSISVSVSVGVSVSASVSYDIIA